MVFLFVCHDCEKRVEKNARAGHPPRLGKCSCGGKMHRDWMSEAMGETRAGIAKYPRDLLSLGVPPHAQKAWLKAHPNEAGRFQDKGGKFRVYSRSDLKKCLKARGCHDHDDYSG